MRTVLNKLRTRWFLWRHPELRMLSNSVTFNRWLLLTEAGL